MSAPFKLALGKFLETVMFLLSESPDHSEGRASADLPDGRPFAKCMQIFIVYPWGCLMIEGHR